MADQGNERENRIENEKKEKKSNGLVKENMIIRTDLQNDCNRKKEKP